MVLTASPPAAPPAAPRWAGAFYAGMALAWVALGLDGLFCIGSCILAAYVVSVLELGSAVSLIGIAFFAAWIARLVATLFLQVRNLLGLRAFFVRWAAVQVVGWISVLVGFGAVTAFANQPHPNDYGFTSMLAFAALGCMVVLGVIMLLSAIADAVILALMRTSRARGAFGEDEATMRQWW